MAMLNSHIKATIRGTHNYHDTMQSVAIHGMQRLAGYIPHVADSSFHSTLPPVTEPFNKNASFVIQQILGSETLTECNPRSLYLFLAWVLVGSDNPYQLVYSLEDVAYARRVAYQYLLIAMGEAADTTIIQRHLGYDLSRNRFVAQYVADVAGSVVECARKFYEDRYLIHQVKGAFDRITTLINYYPDKYPIGLAIAHGSMKRNIIENVYQEYRDTLGAWSMMTDLELLPAIRNLLIDILQLDK